MWVIHNSSQVVVYVIYPAKENYFVCTEEHHRDFSGGALGQFLRLHKKIKHVCRNLIIWSNLLKIGKLIHLAARGHEPAFLFAVVATMSKVNNLLLKH